MKKNKKNSSEKKLTHNQIRVELGKSVKKITSEIANIEKFIKNNHNVTTEDIDVVFKKDDGLSILKLRLKLLLQTILVCYNSKRLYDLLKDYLDRFGDSLSESKKREIWDQMADCVKTMDENGCLS